MVWGKSSFIPSKKRGGGLSRKILAVLKGGSFIMLRGASQIPTHDFLIF